MPVDLCSFVSEWQPLEGVRVRFSEAFSGTETVAEEKLLLTPFTVSLKSFSPPLSWVQVLFFFASINKTLSTACLHDTLHSGSPYQIYRQLLQRSLLNYTSQVGKNLALTRMALT